MEDSDALRGCAADDVEVGWSCVVLVSARSQGEGSRSRGKGKKEGAEQERGVEGKRSMTSVKAAS